MMLKDVLKEARLREGFTQEQIANKVKVAKQTYLKWENGDTEPKATQIKLLAENLNVSADEICNGKLNTKYTLEEFIWRLAKATRHADLETLNTWKHVPDHKQYFDSLAPQEESDLYIAKDIEEQKMNAHFAVNQHSESEE